MSRSVVSVGSVGRGGGRPLDGVWHFFIRHHDEDGTLKGTCKGCHTTISPVVRRLWTHAESCLGLVDVGFSVPIGDHDMSVDETGTQSSVSSAASSSVGSTSSSCMSVGLKRKRQMLLQPVVTDPESKRRLDIQMTASHPR